MVITLKVGDQEFSQSVVIYQELQKTESAYKKATSELFNKYAFANKLGRYGK